MIFCFLLNYQSNSLHNQTKYARFLLLKIEVKEEKPAQKLVDFLSETVNNSGT